MKKKKVVKEVRKPFTLWTFTEGGAKVLAKRYEAMGYKHISVKHDSKKQVYINTFK